MIQKIPRYLLTFYSTSGAMAVERYCKENGIEAEFADEIEGKWSLDI